MHEPVQGQLENLLARKGRTAEGDDSMIHLQSCSECLSEFNSMKAQSELFQLLRAPEEMEPAVGFYARVLQTIEDHARHSIWAGFIYSPVRTRLAYMSLSLAVLLGVYVVAQETNENNIEQQRVVAQQFYSGAPVYGDAPMFGTPSQQRDAVLVNFASH